jgi:MiaB/RimO family radical SAM methylthiotransferase
MIAHAQNLQHSTVQKWLYLKSYGCQMNVYDGQRMTEALAPLGFALTENPEEADLAILNTCHIRAKAEDKLFSDLGRLRQAKVRRREHGQDAIIVVAGCVGQALGHEILKKTPYVDVVVGPQTYHTLPETVMKIIWQRQDIGPNQPTKIQSTDPLEQESVLVFQGKPIQDTIQDTNHDTEDALRQAVRQAPRHPEQPRQAQQHQGQGALPAQNPSQEPSQKPAPRIQPYVALGFPKMEKFDELPSARGAQGPCAFLSIQEGCNQFCRYCVVPFTRGPEYSRPVSQVMEEARQLIDRGAKEIMLLGQNVNAYHGTDEAGKEVSLGRLLMRLGQLDGLVRLRYTTSHPRSVDEDLLIAHRDVPVVMPFLHLPVQSGSDSILRHMNRKYTAKFYLETIEKFLSYRPDMAFSSDFIVGYPGESDADFQATYDLAQQVGFAQAYSFKYSPRTGTPAAMMAQVDESIKDERLYRLQDLLSSMRRQFNDRFVGQETLVMAEPVRKDRTTPQEDQPTDPQNQADAIPAQRQIGKTAFSQTVHFTGPQIPVGSIVSVKIQEALTNSLIGTAS